MMNKNFEEILKRTAGDSAVRLFEPMSLHTTFRCGGRADYYAEPEDEETLRAITALCRQEKMPFFVIGKGSNLLVSDKGYHGLILAIGPALGEIRADGCEVTAGAGASLAGLARFCAERGLGGAEFASGIPGSLGGAVYMNAGAYGGEMKQIVTAVRVLTREGDILIREAGDLAFGYRTSAVRTNGDIVLSAKMQLTGDDPQKILETMEELNRRRREKQPLNYPSAGSTFKRPEGAFAGKLIQDAGLSGRSIGDARVSEKHCGFIINGGHATASEVRQLIEEVRETVLKSSGYLLECEVCFLGDF